MISNSEIIDVLLIAKESLEEEIKSENREIRFGERHFIERCERIIDTLRQYGKNDLQCDDCLKSESLGYKIFSCSHRVQACPICSSTYGHYHGFSCLKLLAEHARSYPEPNDPFHPHMPLHGKKLASNISEQKEKSISIEKLNEMM